MNSDIHYRYSYKWLTTAPVIREVDTLLNLSLSFLTKYLRLYEDTLNRTEQPRKATRALNSLIGVNVFWSIKNNIY